MTPVNLCIRYGMSRAVVKVILVIATVVAVAVGHIATNSARVDYASSLMLPDAMQMKAEILRRIPINSSIEFAREIMTNEGFACGLAKNTRYADFGNILDKQVNRGPADILHCDSGQRSSGLMWVSKRWQVSFEDVDGRVTYIATGVGLTGP